MDYSQLGGGGGSGGGGAMPSSASSAATGAVNITNSDGSLSATGAFLLAATGLAFFLGFVAVVALLRRQ